MDRRKLTEIDACARLDTRDISDKSLNSLPKSLFQDLTNLSSLDLSYNEISSLNVDIFQYNSGIQSM